MKDFVVYHNPDVMGLSVEKVNGLSIVTDKKVNDIKGNRVWLITGEGTPRTFLLRSYFIVDRFEIGDGYQTKLSGKDGKLFDPMLELNREEWFDDFKSSQGNFAFGLQRIKNDKYIYGLEDIAKLPRK
jgi:hypothetical protein